LEIVGSRAGHLWGALYSAYEVLGSDDAAGGDEVFRDLAMARNQICGSAADYASCRRGAGACDTKLPLEHPNT
jgi:hypothetical protein